MKIQTIYISSHFERAFKKLPKALKEQALRREKYFRANAFDPRLKTHKLKGHLEGFWSFSLNYSHRILFEFLGDSEVAFVDIGDHQIYQ